MHEKPFNFESIKVPVSESETQTDVTQTIIEFVTSGSQKYEQLHLQGLINTIDTRNQVVIEEPIEDYIQKLVTQEQEDRVLFTKRRKVILSELQKLKEEKLEALKNPVVAADDGSEE